MHVGFGVKTDANQPCPEHQNGNSDEAVCHWKLAALTSISVIARDSFKFKKRCQLFVGNNDGSSGDFADSLTVFAAPKRIGLRSYIRLSGVLVKLSPINYKNIKL